MTIAYGDNGTGKSGYARVIKKACRARGSAQDILPNVYNPADKGPASARITCRVGAVSTPVEWKDGTPTDPRLANIFVFDSVSAKHHLSTDGPATFIPRGLDVLPKLAQACDQLKGRLTAEISTEQAAITLALSG